MRGPQGVQQSKNLMIGKSYFCEIECGDFLRFAACLRAKSGTHP